MKLSIDFGRWTTTKAALAAAGLLAIGGAVGSALAIGPTVPAPVQWQGGWELVTQNLATYAPAFNVPADRKLLITDLILGNNGTTSARFNLYNATAGSCSSSSAVRLHGINTPAGDTIVVPLTTGIGFASGQVVCIQAVGGPLDINMRGFLFTAAPAS